MVPITVLFNIADLGTGCTEGPLPALRDDAPHNAALGINVVEGLRAVIRRFSHERQLWAVRVIRLMSA